MSSPMSKRLLIVALGTLALGLTLVLFTKVCYFGGGMPGRYTQCRCLGIEWQLYDQTAADGQRKTLCFGVVTSRKCFQSPGGPEIPCNGKLGVSHLISAAEMR